MTFRYTMIGAAICIFIFYFGLLASLLFSTSLKGFWESLVHPSTLFSIRDYDTLGRGLDDAKCFIGGLKSLAKHKRGMRIIIFPSVLFY